MGIYWCVIDEKTKEKFSPPGKFSIKSPGIFHPISPFPGMVMMMNSYGYNFELINDSDWEGPYYSSDYKDITDKVYQMYIEQFSWAKDGIYEPKE